MRKRAEGNLQLPQTIHLFTGGRGVSYIMCVPCWAIPWENRKYGPERDIIQSMSRPITDPDDKFAKWPGSSHDPFVFRTSEFKDYLQANHATLDDGVVIGDSGYALSNFLMTPYENPANRKQRRFNVTLKTCCSSGRSTFFFLC